MNLSKWRGSFALSPCINDHITLGCILLDLGFYTPGKENPCPDFSVKPVKFDHGYLREIEKPSARDGSLNLIFNGKLMTAIP